VSQVLTFLKNGMILEEVRITSWSELHDAMFDKSWNPEIKRFRSTFAFRGLNQNHERIENSLMQLGENYAAMERHLVRNFRKYAHKDVVEYDSIWNWLSLAKHHGLPTRLVDWTFSPYVAMHFLTSSMNRYNEDGAIWVVDYVEVHKHLPGRLRELLSEEGSDVFTIEMLNSAIKDLNEFDSISDEVFLLFYEPPSIDQRIINQYALFSLLSSPDIYVDEWLKKHPEIARKFIIPADLKWEIRDKLDQANITERVLFPGLDGLSIWLKRLYTTRS
jgi:hypothetical protein